MSAQIVFIVFMFGVLLFFVAEHIALYLHVKKHHPTILEKLREQKESRP